MSTARRADRNATRTISDQRVYTTDWASASTNKLEDEADMAWYDDARVQTKLNESLPTRKPFSLLALSVQALSPSNSVGIGCMSGCDVVRDSASGTSRRKHELFSSARAKQKKLKLNPMSCK